MFSHRMEIQNMRFIRMQQLDHDDDDDNNDDGYDDNGMLSSSCLLLTQTMKNGFALECVSAQLV